MSSNPTGQASFFKKIILDNQSLIFINVFIDLFIYCQAQSKLQVKLRLKTELAFFPFNSATHPNPTPPRESLFSNICQ
jgi:hypothetical protein